MNTTQQGIVKWQSPANIALIKYWGKKGPQIPANPSISFTLEKSYTEMQLQWQSKTKLDNAIDLQFYFEGKENNKFKQKITDFLNTRIAEYPFLTQLELTIHSENSFPHSAGIASSASSMSALALCLCSLEKIFLNTLQNETDFFRKASFLARLASGSASRSLYGGLVTWGKILELNNTEDEVASPLQNTIHPVFNNYQDAVLVVSRSEKATSSRAGHALMDAHPFKEARYHQAYSNMQLLINAIATGDTETFGNITENEALTLHSLMMTSNPSVLLLLGNSLEIIHHIRTFRAEKRLPLCFTIDAGPNIHLLFPADIKTEIHNFITEQLAPLCESNYWIADQVGNGPKQLT